MISSISRALTIASFSLFATACATSRPAESTRTVAATTTTTTTTTGSDGTHTSSSSQTLAANSRCDNWNVYFATGSSDVTPATRNALSGLADCVKTGNVSTIYLIGSADPRGASSENDQLGLARANSIRTVLLDYGCPSSLVVSYSIGERNATGSPSDYAAERRVNIRTIESAVN